MSIIKQISNLAQHSAIYAVSTAIQKLPGFLLLPIYTSLDYIPSRSDFGEYVMIFTFIAFMNFFYTYGMDSAMLRYFFLGEKDRKTVFSSTFYVLLATSLVTTALLLLFSPALAGLILKKSSAANFIQIAGLILIFDALGNLPYLILRAEEKSIQFTVYRGIRFILELLLNILFVVVLRQGVLGILYTSLAAAVINLIIMTPIIARYLVGRVDLPLAKELLMFGLPFLPNGIAFTTIEMIDRFIVPEILGKDVLGVYGANYKFGAILLLLINAFRNAWQPFFLKIAKQDNARQIYARVLTYFWTGAAAVVLLVTLFIRDLLTFPLPGGRTILGTAYWEGIGIIPIILLSYCFYGIYVILTPGFYIRKKSKYMIVFTGSGAAVNIIANLLLLPWLNSFWGAAWATLISYATMAATIYLVSNRIYPLQIEWGRLGRVALLLLGVLGSYYFLAPPLWMRLLLAVTVIAYTYGWVLTDGERNAMKRGLGKLRGR